MSEKMTERQRVVIINVAMLVSLIWCCFRGYPLVIVLSSGVFLLAFANILMYLKRRRVAKRQ
jgi:hypothetical protein